MRYAGFRGAPALFVLLCLLIQAAPVGAQQPSATTPPQPTARPGQTTPPRAPQPSQPTASPTPVPTPQEEPTPQIEHRTERLPQGFEQQLGSRPARALTLDEAIKLALGQSSAYRLTQIDERIAAEDVKQARAALFPQFTAPLTYFGNTPSQVREEGEPLTFSYVSSSAINETIALLNASGELDISGRLRASLRRSRYQLDAARAGTLIARRQLALETVDAYFNLVLARDRRRYAEETLALAEGFLKVTEDVQRRGEDESEGADLLRASAQVSARRDELEQARAGEVAALNVLRSLTGIDFETPISVSGISQDLPTTSDFNNFTEEQLKTRPEFNQVESLRRAALEEARSARGERLPQLTYTINGGFDAADFRPLKRYAGGSAIVTLTIPIFDFGASRSRETQARLRAQTAEVQRENTLRQLRQEFYTARATALGALVRIRETKSAVDNALKNLMIILARYRAKKATITDVVDAQSAFVEARLANSQAIIDYRTSRVRLEQNLGQ
ncbi:MAG: TolC family protein [Pyrinomonadaceae bacterium]|nr:TolC family protein [Pyrinomonadaceae bacterium]